MRYKYRFLLREILLIALLCLLASLLPDCLFHLLFGLPCPSCGLTRAHYALLRLDFAGAFACHPLFFTVIPTVGYLCLRDILPKKLPFKLELVLGIMLLAAFLTVYIIRLYNGDPLLTVDFRGSLVGRVWYTLFS